MLGVDEVELSDPEYAIPVADTKTSLKSMLSGFDNNAALVLNPDGNMALHYKGTFIVKNTIDFFGCVEEYSYSLQRYSAALCVEIA